MQRCLPALVCLSSALQTLIRHEDTGVLLASGSRKYGRPISGQQEVCGKKKQAGVVVANHQQLWHMHCVTSRLSSSTFGESQVGTRASILVPTSIGDGVSCSCSPLKHGGGPPRACSFRSGHSQSLALRVCCSVVPDHTLPFTGSCNSCNDELELPKVDCDSPPLLCTPNLLAFSTMLYNKPECSHRL